jgi:hypothetical protein
LPKKGSEMKEELQDRLDDLFSEGDGESAA